jgi:hypothetical protein
MSAAEIGPWARVENVTVQDVRDRLWKSRELVKTWSMRGTLHLHAASDLSLYVAALKTRLGYLSPPWLKFHKITSGEMQRITAGVRDVLDRRCLTREQLVDMVVKKAELRPWVRTEMLSGWGSLLHPAAFQGNLCFGPAQGKNVTFVRPDQWLEHWTEQPSGEALKTLCRRFLTAFGPSTYQDFAHWWGVQDADARKIFSSLTSELEQVEFSGYTASMLMKDLKGVLKLESRGSVRLLPSFDCYAMFYHPREMFVPDEHRSLVFRQLAGWISPVLIVNGSAAGVWTLKKRTRNIDVKVTPFLKLSKIHRRGLQEEANSLGDFLEVKVELSISGRQDSGLV